MKEKSQYRPRRIINVGSWLTLEEAQWFLINEALVESGGHMPSVLEWLGITRSTVGRHLKIRGLSIKDFKSYGRARARERLGGENKLSRPLDYSMLPNSNRQKLGTP